MELRAITKQLMQAYPPSMALPWDNPGLQVGRMGCQVQKVLVALDATREVIEEGIAARVQLLVTHHPLLMSGVKKFSEEEYLGEKALTLAEHGIAHFAMHTNYDTARMGELAACAMGLQNQEILEVTGSWPDGRDCGIGKVGELPGKMSAAECCSCVKKAFSLPDLRLFGDPCRMIGRVAISPGSGKSMIGPALAARADLLITGDIGHHEGIDATDQGLLVIDAGHYGIEHLFIADVAAWLTREFPQLEVRQSGQKAPFHVL